MVRFLFSIILVLLTIDSFNARNVVIMVSRNYTGAEMGRRRIKMHGIKEAFDYCNKYKGNRGIEIVLEDEVNVIDSTLLLRSTNVPIIIRAKKGMSVITSGNLVDTGFFQTGDTLTFPIANQCRMLLVNGINAPIANTFTVDKSMNQLRDVRKIDEYHYTATLNAEDLLKLEIGCDLFLYTRWLCYKMRVTAINRITNTVSLSTMGKNALYATDEGVRYTIYNSRRVMQPGSFCYNDDKVYYLRKQGEIVSSIRFTIPTVATLVRVYKCNNVTFQGISFENATLEDWYFQEIQGASLCSRAVLVENSSGIHYKDCDFHNNMGYSLAIGNNSSNCSVKGCCFTNLQGGGIILGMKAEDSTNNITITDNLIKGYGRVNVCCEGILSQRAHHVTITKNTIFDGYYSGISLGWTWGFDKSYSHNNYVALNHVHHLMQGVLNDGGGIYTLGIQNGTVIEKNCIHDIYPDKEMACLIYLDEGSSEIMVNNNVCYSSKRGINESYGRNNVIENNIIGYIDNWGVRLSYPNRDKNLLVRRNLIISNETIAIDSNIHKSSLSDNVIVPYSPNETHNIGLDSILDLSSDYSIVEEILDRKTEYGCKTRRLRRLEAAE